MAGEDDALNQSAFAARLMKMGAPSCFAVAVSGGRDSMALAHLAAGFARSTGAQVFAFTVDHGLRPEAAAEAAQAKAWCEALGLVHETLQWRGEKPETGLQAAARAARYRLLVEAAAKAGCRAVVTAHTRDDQAETVWMRLRRGAGVRGLAAMRSEIAIASGAGAPLRLLRPMLDFSRAGVTQYLKAAGQSYIDDPSNEDHRFERVRARAILKSLGKDDELTTDALAATAGNLQPADDLIRASERALFDQAGGCFHAWGGVSLDHWDGTAPAAASLAARLIYAVGGAADRPADDASRAALLQAAETGAATLSGVLIKRHRRGLWLVREPAALTGRAGVAPLAAQPLAGAILWDNRFIVSPAAAGLNIAPMGADAAAFLGPRASLFQGPQEALAALPGLYQQGVLIGAPALPFTGTREAFAHSLTEERFEGRIIRFS